MRILQINAYCDRGSTGKICTDISKVLTENGVENFILYTIGESKNRNYIKYSMGYIYEKIQSLKARILGNNGFNCMLLTLKLIKIIKKLNVDIVHLHNLHAQNCNLGLLMRYLRKHNKNVVITLHDAWLLTGYCMYPGLSNCDKWQFGCHNCPQKKTYTWILDRSKTMWTRKKKLFEGMQLEIIVPSQWMKEMVGKSYLKNNKISVINNAIDLNIFKPTTSNLKKTYHMSGKYMVLGCADCWDQRKGVEAFVELSKRLGREYKIVMVGVGNKLRRMLPDAILAIKKTKTQKELVEIYSAADVFFNPTIDEVFGMVNIESLACGTPVVMYHTGGCPECIDRESGIVVEKGNIDEAIKGIQNICHEGTRRKEECMRRARMFEKTGVYKRYLEIYSKINEY